MCRHLAYLGPPVPLSRWLFEHPHALLQQASAPADMRGGGTVNADGFGFGWYPGPGATPERYRRAVPMWADPFAARLAATTEAAAMLGAARNATTGMPLLETACAPFTAGRWLFSLNGRIAGWPDSAVKLAAQVPLIELLTWEAASDSVLLWALLRGRLAGGEPAAQAVAATVAEVATAAPGSRLNLLLVDPEAIVATTVTHSLWVRPGPESVLVSSEPLDGDAAWSEVPDGSLVVATPAHVDVSPLPIDLDQGGRV